jgi:transposase-like protein
MAQLSLEAKEAIVTQALTNRNQSIAEIAHINNVGYSTLQKWLRMKREGKSISTRQSNNLVWQSSKNGRLEHLLATANLDDVAIGVYCRQHGIYSHQLTQWKDDFMSNSSDKKFDQQKAELRVLKAEIKKLKKDLNRKDKALAETSALLVLKKKASLIWGDQEDD